MSNSIADGVYRIANLYNPTLMLDVVWGSALNGTNVWVHNDNGASAQLWTVSTRADGTRKITSAYIGKSLDIPAAHLVTGENVQVWDDNDSSAQTWDISDAGQTGTVDGKTYQAFFIKSHKAPSLVVETSGYTPVENTNIVLSTNESTSKDQMWMFVPAKTVVSKGLYEIRPEANPALCIDDYCAQTANGTNLRTWGENDANAQKFVLVLEDASSTPQKWSIRNVTSGKYVDVNAAEARNGANVQIWEDNDCRAQRWAVYPVDNVNFRGKQVSRVRFGSFVTSDGHTYALDNTENSSGWDSNVEIWEWNDAAAQRWLLVPTTATDAFMPVPAKLGISETVGGGTSTSFGILKADAKNGANRYFGWTCSDAWVTTGPNHYEYRYRSRFAKANGGYSDWSGYTDWTVHPVRQKGTAAWCSIPYKFAFDPAKYKAQEVELQVRSAGVSDDGTQGLHGSWATSIVKAALKPTVKLTDAGWSPDGLRISYESDYSFGLQTVEVASVEIAGKRVAARCRSRGLDASGSILIPQSKMTSIPADGSTAHVAYRLGTDVASFADTSKATVTVAYDAESRTTVTPTATVADNLTVSVKSTDIGTMHAYVEVDGKVSDARPYGSDGAWNVPVPFGSAYTLWVTGTSADGDKWFTWHKDMPALPISGHSWSIGGNTYTIGLREGEPLAENMKLTAENSTVSLLGREYQEVQFNGVKDGGFNAEGAIVYDRPLGTTVEGVQSLVGKRAHYRGPFGWQGTVAVTDVSTVKHRLWAQVTVSMVVVNG